MRTLLAICTVVTLASGCISIQGDPRLLKCVLGDDPHCVDELSGISERSAIDSEAVRAKLRARADEITAQLEAGHSLVPKTSSLYARLQQLFWEMADLLDQYDSPAYMHTMEEKTFFAPLGTNSDELYKQVTASPRQDVLDVDLRIIRHDLPGAYTFPNNRIYVTTGLIDPSAPYAPRSDDALAGVIAHELLHLYEQHIVEHWAALEASGYTKAKLAVAVLSYFSPVQINVARPAPDVHRLAERIEYLADSGAARLLRMAGRDPSHFLDYLGTLGHIPNSASPLVEAIDARQACLRQCMAPSKSTYHAFRTEWERSRETKEKDADGGYRESVLLTPRATEELEPGLSVLDPTLQYYLCAKASMELDAPGDSKIIRQWLGKPENIPLEQLRSRVSADGQEFISDILHGLSGHEIKTDRFRIARDFTREAMQRWWFGGGVNVTGDRLNLMDGCPREMSEWNKR